MGRKTGFENFVRLENKFCSPCEKNQCALEINFQHLENLGFSGLLDGKGVFGVGFLYLLVGRIILFVSSAFEAQKPP
ncbi:MAG: hypothetical protein NC206_00170 [Bacteroides sp.]|nr:hypothetical protein [Roseburia sp.]MCM1345491.1 hypothetical protein [Bacteroides sp.]MCM1420000.1 hypothetical protein [Bacteroides sp.]